MMTLWHVVTGEPRQCDPVDAREILATSTEWTKVDPNPPAPPMPQPEKRDADIYGREPVGINPPESPIDRGGPFIRGNVSATYGTPSPDHRFIRAKRDADATTKRPRRFPGE